jgi:hypothetical protein
MSDIKTIPTEWIYFFEEPKRHKGLIELGRTGRTVEDRNRDKRSVDTWKEIARYPVVSCEQAEKEIIKATKIYRYGHRKEILEVDWTTLKYIIEPICQKYTHHEMKLRMLKSEAQSLYQSSLKQLIFNKDKQETLIKEKYRKKINGLIETDAEIKKIEESPNEDLWIYIFGVFALFFFMLGISYPAKVGKLGSVLPAHISFFILSFFFLFGFIVTIYENKKEQRLKIQEIINKHKKNMYQEEKTEINALNKAFEIMKQAYDTSLMSKLSKFNLITKTN